MADQQQQPENMGLIEYRLSAIEKAVSSISDNMGKLVLLEQKHMETREALARAFKTIEALDVRVKAMEDELPTLKMTRGWVIAGTLGTISVVGIFAFKVIFQMPA